MDWLPSNRIRTQLRCLDSNMPYLLLRLFAIGEFDFSAQVEQQAIPWPVSSQQSGHAALPQFLQPPAALDVDNIAYVSALQFESPGAFSVMPRETR